MDKFEGPSAWALEIQKWKGQRGTFTRNPKQMKKRPQKLKELSKKTIELFAKSSWEKKSIKPRKIKKEPITAQIRIKKEACTLR